MSAVYNIVNLVSGGTNLYFSCGSEFVHIALSSISVLSGVMLLCHWISGSRRFDPLSSLGLLVLWKWRYHVFFETFDTPHRTS